MTAALIPLLKSFFLDNNGRPLVGGQVFSYVAGTSTKLDTYSDPAGVVPNTNPVILDYRGEASIYIPINTGYKFVLASASDTDPPTSPIWSVDDVKNLTLFTLYGGVDGGVTNAYTLSFDTPYDSYTDGWQIAWIPSNTNTGASTINVNGLGIVSIVNQDGTPLTSSLLVAGQVATFMYKSGQFLLISSGIAPSVVSGSFTPAWSGFSVAPTGDIFYTKIGGLVLLQFDAIGTTGTSNATTMTITNLPAILRPQSAPNVRNPCIVTDNGAQAAGAFGFSGIPASTIVFAKGTAPPNASGFTNSGSKGFEPYTNLIYTAL